MERLNGINFDWCYIFVDVIGVFIFCIFVDVLGDVFGICVYVRW